MAEDAFSRPISNQNMGDCTLNALADACELVSGEGIDYSRRFITEEGERQIGELDSSIPWVGMGIRTAASAIHRIGICAESLCPYDWPIKKQPDPAAYADAEKRIAWFEFEELDVDDVDAALAMPNTVVVISHYVGAEWTNAKPDSVIDFAYGDASHTTVLTEKLADGTYRDRNSWGPAWADRGTVRVTRRFVEGTLARWRVTYKGPLFEPKS
jgi:hypothetical protein